mgnify:CR=1 FL=1
MFIQWPYSSIWTIACKPRNCTTWAVRRQTIRLGNAITRSSLQTVNMNALNVQPLNEILRSLAAPRGGAGGYIQVSFHICLFERLKLVCTKCCLSVYVHSIVFDCDWRWWFNSCDIVYVRPLLNQQCLRCVSACVRVCVQVLSLAIQHTCWCVLCFVNHTVLGLNLSSVLVRVGSQRASNTTSTWMISRTGTHGHHPFISRIRIV